jgi:hypothetical protein
VAAAPLVLDLTVRDLDHDASVELQVAIGGALHDFEFGDRPGVAGEIRDGVGRQGQEAGEGEGEGVEGDDAWWTPFDLRSD